MASSGVWENVFLTITPTFDGAHGMLCFTILDGFFAKILTYFHFFFGLFWPNLLYCFMLQMLLSHLVCNHWMLLADVIAIWLCMADVFSHCGRYESHCVFYLWKTTV